MMRGILYDRIKRGVLLTSVGAAFLVPVAAAQASQSSAPAYGYWSHGPVSKTQHGAQPSGGKVTGHRIG
jgi:hypothetical protein